MDGNWHKAQKDLHEKRRHIDECRKNSYVKPQSDQDTKDGGASIVSRYLRKRPVKLHMVVFVKQTGLKFGRDAIPPRVRRPVVVLRDAVASGKIVGAPMTTKPGGARNLYVAHYAQGLNWQPSVLEPKDSNVYDTAEYIKLSDIWGDDADWYLAQIEEPLLGKVCDFVLLPPPNVQTR